MNIQNKLDYIRGKLGLLPAFGDTIGKDVNKAELGLCRRFAETALAVHLATVAELHAAQELLMAVACQPADVLPPKLREKMRAQALDAQAVLRDATESD